MQKIKNIEFLRVIGCLAIILFHIGVMHKIFPSIELYNKFSVIFENGSRAVELFFIISGFFFVYTLDKEKSCFEFLKNKLIRIYPTLVFVIILYFLFSLTGSLKFTFYDNILTLFCLTGTGLNLVRANANHFWFVSAMLWSLFFYFYLVKNYQKKNVYLFIALTILFAYTLILHEGNGVICGIEQTNKFIINAGMLRALGSIGIGYFIGEWYKNNIDKIKNWNANIYQTTLISGIEFVTLYFIVNNLMFHKLKYNNHFIFVIAFTTIIILFLTKKGIFSRILDSDIWSKLSKYTYSIYMIHFPIYGYLGGSIWKHHAEIVYAHPVLNFVFTILLVIIAGILTYHLIEKPCVDYFKRKSETEQINDKNCEVQNVSNPCGGGGIDLFTKCFYCRIPLNTI